MSFLSMSIEASQLYWICKATKVRRIKKSWRGRKIDVRTTNDWKSRHNLVATRMTWRGREEPEPTIIMSRVAQQVRWSQVWTARHVIVSYVLALGLSLCWSSSIDWLLVQGLFCHSPRPKRTTPYTHQRYLRTLCDNTLFCRVCHALCYF